MGATFSSLFQDYFPFVAALLSVAIGILLYAHNKAAPPQVGNDSTGISFMDVYFPPSAVQSSALCEQSNAFVVDREDIASMALTVTSSLLEKSGVNAKDIGSVIVATSSETPFYSTSAISSVLLQLLFSPDTEGSTVSDGSIGGSMALFDAVRWVNSQPMSETKSAIVVVVDINLPLQAGGVLPAATGCAAVAFLISKNSPLSVEPFTRTVFRSNSLKSNYEDVIHSGFQLFREKWNKAETLNSATGFERFERVVMHAASTDDLSRGIDSLSKADALDPSNKILFGEKELWKSCDMSTYVGNSGVANLFMNLALMISEYGEGLHAQDVLLVDYSDDNRSHPSAVFFILRCASSDQSKELLRRMKVSLGVMSRLRDRDVWEPQCFLASEESRISVLHGTCRNPSADVATLYPGTYYIDSFDEHYLPRYALKLSTHPRVSMLESPPQSAAAKSKEDPQQDVATTAIRQHTESTVWATGRHNVEVVVTGVSAGLPGREGAVFPSDNAELGNIHRIISGENFITSIPDAVKDSMIEKNVVKLSRGVDGKLVKNPVTEYSQNINMCASIGSFDLTRYGVSESIASTMDKAVQVAVAAGLEALKDAGIVDGKGEGTTGWVLPESMRQTTGVMYATSFPALDTAISEVSSFFRSKLAEQISLPNVIDSLRLKMLNRIVALSEDGAEQELPEAVENALLELGSYLAGTADEPVPKYEFDRKFLFRVLVLGNAQLAQITKAMGPNVQTNAACAGSTQAVAFAYDMIQAGRAERMIVIAGDSASSDNLMPWLGNGFLALGAATTQADIRMAALPFDVRRTGMILGSGGIGMILETEDGAKRRHALSSKTNSDFLIAHPSPFKCRILGTLFSNSAFHGASLDRKHIAEELERFIASIETERGISRKEIATHGVYFSHETSTNAEPSKSCASNEVFALRKVFGDDLPKLLILNTKGLTGHPMGVSFEDVVAAEVLFTGTVPPIANLQEPDPFLGSDIKYSTGGSYECKYALRFAAGFGSQIAIALYGKH